MPLPERQVMNDFIRRRIEYLKNLPSLKEGWIAGGGVVEGQTPSQAACDAAIAHLTALAKLEPLAVDLVTENVLIGPLVQGGVSMDWRLPSLGLVAVLSWRNDLTAELYIWAETDVDVDGTFGEVHDAALATVMTHLRRPQ